MPTRQAAKTIASAAGAPSATANLTYHNGPVMQTVTPYLIFWHPSGLEYGLNGAADPNYQPLIERFLADLNGSAYYGLLNQYDDSASNRIQNSVSYNLAQVWDDTASAYPHAGTGDDPLVPADISAEIARAEAHFSVTPSMSIEFFIFLPNNIWDCAANCGSSKPGFSGFSPVCPPFGNGTCIYDPWCAYRGVDSSNNALYAVLGDGASYPNACSWNSSPNDDIGAEGTITQLALELFGSVSDPLVNAWYDSDGSGEIGDKCAWRNNGNVTINGHTYLIQEEWSNEDWDGGSAAYSGCQYARPAPCTGGNPAITDNTGSTSIPKGTGVIFTAHVTCPKTPMYQWWQGQWTGSSWTNWTVIQSYSTNGSVNWNTSALNAGTQYAIALWAENQYAPTNLFDTFPVSRTFTITSGSACANPSVAAIANGNTYFAPGPVTVPSGVGTYLFGYVNTCPSPDYKWFQYTDVNNAWTNPVTLDTYTQNLNPLYWVAPSVSSPTYFLVQFLAQNAGGSNSAWDVHAEIVFLVNPGGASSGQSSGAAVGGPSHPAGGSLPVASGVSELPRTNLLHPQPDPW
jgi:hypothetical protein